MGPRVGNATNRPGTVSREGERRYDQAYDPISGSLGWSSLFAALPLITLPLSGQTITLGLWLAGAGGIFAFLASIIGWIGVAVTGSDTSSNALFGALQVKAASSADLSPTLIAAANSFGGVLGKMISPQNLAIGAAAVGMGDREGDLFARWWAGASSCCWRCACWSRCNPRACSSWMVPCRRGRQNGGVPGSDVYATAARQGLRTRVASPLAARARARRHEAFFALTRVGPSSRIVDLGCGGLGLRAFAPELDVTGVDRLPKPEYPGTFVQADVTARLPFGDGEFDLAYSSSLIEHLPPARRPAFVAEVRRVARGWFVQTPARSFPLEPHALLPFAHWLPPRLRRAYWHLGVAGEWEDISLLRRSEMEELFGEPVLAERLLGLAKSWISVRPVGRWPGGPGAQQRPGPP